MKDNTREKHFNVILSEDENFQWELKEEIIKHINIRFWIILALQVVLLALLCVLLISSR